jgi:hypothetical protein
MELRDGPISGRNSPPPRYSTTEDRIHEAESDSNDWAFAEGSSGPRGRRHGDQADLPLRLCIFVGVSWMVGLYLAYPAPTTVPIFIGSAFVLATWTVLSWVRVLRDITRRKDSLAAIRDRYPLRFRTLLGLATALLLWWTLITLFPATEPAPVLGQDKQYFVAVNLHNNEAILHDFIEQMTLLIFHRECDICSGVQG